MHVLSERLYLNADRTKVVSEESGDAAFLLGGPGDEIPEDQAEELGLLKKKAKPKDKARSKAGDKAAQPENEDD